MAVRDGMPYLRETLAALDAQTAPSALVVAEDGSTDETPDVLRAYAARRTPPQPVTILETGGVGLAAARNRALATVTAPYTLILDADDLIAPTLTARSVDLAAARDDLDLVYPLFDHMDEAGRLLGVRSRTPRGPLTPAGILTANPIHSDSGVLVRTEALRRAGGFDEALPGCVGLDAWRRVVSLRAGNSACLPEPLVRYRRSAGQITADAGRMAQSFARVLAKADDTLSAAERARVIAAQHLYFASLAYEQGAAREARRHTLAAWRAAPRSLAMKPYAYARAAISMASLAPAPVHDGLKRLALAARSARARRDVQADGYGVVAASHRTR